MDIVTILVISLCFFPQILSMVEGELTSDELINIDCEDENYCLDNG